MRCPTRSRRRRAATNGNGDGRGVLPGARPRSPPVGAERRRRERRGWLGSASSSCSRLPAPPARSSTRTGATRRPRGRADAARDARSAGASGERKLEYRLHRVSDWVTGANHEIADLLHDSTSSHQGRASLEGVPRAVVMQWLLLVESHLLGFLERYRHEPLPSRGGRALRRQRARRAAPDRGLLLPRPARSGRACATSTGWSGSASCSSPPPRP